MLLDYYTADPEYFIDTERSTARRPNRATNRRKTYTVNNTENDNDEDYESERERERERELERERERARDEKQRQRIGLPSKNPPPPRNEPPPMPSSFRRPIIGKQNTVVLSKRSEKSSSRQNSNYDYELENDDFDSAYNVRVVKTKPGRKKKVIVYHSYDENGEEEGEPHYEVSYEDDMDKDEFYEEPRRESVYYSTKSNGRR